MACQCGKGRAHEGFTGEVTFELEDVFSEVGSEAFCWEGNGTERGKEGLRRMVKSLALAMEVVVGDGSKVREPGPGILLG